MSALEELDRSRRSMLLAALVGFGLWQASSIADVLLGPMGMPPALRPGSWSSRGRSAALWVVQMIPMVRWIRRVRADHRATAALNDERVEQARSQASPVALFAVMGVQVPLVFADHPNRSRRAIDDARRKYDRDRSVPHLRTRVAHHESRAPSEYASCRASPVRSDPGGAGRSRRRDSENDQHRREGRFIPSTMLALKLARALHTTVETLFYLSAQPGQRGVELREGTKVSVSVFRGGRTTVHRTTQLMFFLPDSRSTIPESLFGRRSAVLRFRLLLAPLRDLRVVAGEQNLRHLMPPILRRPRVARRAELPDRRTNPLRALSRSDIAPGSSRTVASMIASAAGSPPLSTKSPSESSSVARWSATRWSTSL